MPGGTWSVESRGGDVLVRFGTHVRAEEGRASAARFLEVLGDRPVRLVFDMRQTRGYETEARKAWQDALWPVRHRLSGIVVSSPSAVVRMGTSLFAAFLGVGCEYVAEPPA